jgi:hypothetical protein
MALFKTRSAAVYCLDAHLIDVEVDMYKSGTARDSITVGMPDTAVRESRDLLVSFCTIVTLLTSLLPLLLSELSKKLGRASRNLPLTEFWREL